MSFFHNPLGKPGKTSRKSSAPKRRPLRLETLENREMLSVSTMEFDAIRSNYADLNLSANMSDYNVIEITASQLNAKNLQAAIDAAAKTTQDDLIVVRTDVYYSTINLGNGLLSIDVDSSQYGGVTFVSLGSERLQIQSHSAAGVVTVGNGEIAFGGVVLSSTYEAMHIDGILRTSSTVQLTTSQFIRTVEQEGLAGNFSAFEKEILDQYQPLSGGSPIGSKTYSITVSVGGTREAYLTGLSLAEKNAIVGGSMAFLNNLDPYDAEKRDVNDTLHCWAASAANMLAYTGWGNVNGFQTEDDIFAYFTSHFTDAGSHQWYANEWFLTGNYRPAGVSGWSQITSPGGAFYPGVNYASVADSPDFTSINSLTNAVNKLKDGCAVGLGIPGHAQTLWGVVYDTSQSIGSSNYYVSILLTDSDDNKPSMGDVGGPNAPNILRNYSITWNASTQEFSMYMDAYNQYTTLTDYTWLAPYQNNGVPTPSNFTNTGITKNAVSFSWNAVSGATGYEIQRSTDQSTWTTVSLASNVVSHTFSGLAASTTYYFRIRAKDGSDTSSWTSVITAKTDDAYSPNQSFSQVDAATAGASNSPNLGVIRGTKTINNLVIAGGDVANRSDYFRFELAATGNSNDYVKIDFLHTQGDLDMHLYDASKSSPIQYSGSSSDSELISLDGLAAGVYYVQIYGYADMTNPNYSLEFYVYSTLTVPAAPTVTPTLQSDNKVKLTWAATANTDYYRVWRKDGSTWTLLKSKVTTLTFTDTAAPNNAQNTYRVRAYNDAGYSDCKDVKVTMIGIPKISAAVQANGSVKLTWTATSNTDYYKVWRLDNGSWTQLSAKVTAATYTDTAAPNNAENTYRVRAYKGTLYSGCEDVTVAMQQAIPQVTATLQSDNKVKLTWGATANTDFYRVWRLDNGKWTQLAAKVTALTFTDAEASHEAVNTYRVRAYKGTVYSGCKDVTILMIGVPKVNAAMQTNGNVKLTWTLTSNTDYYKVWRLDGGKWTLLASDLTTSTFTDTKAPANTENTYRVRAYSGSLYSGCEDVTLKMIGIPQVTATLQSDNKVKLTWAATANTDFYRVWRLDNGKWTLLKSEVTALTFTDTEAPNNTENTYRVRAYKGTTYSDCKDVKVKMIGVPLVKATAQGNSVKLTWAVTSNTDTYKVWRLDNGTWTLLASNLTASTYTDSKAPANAENTYRVRAYKGTVYSACMDVTVKMTSTSSTVPQVTATLQSDNKVKLTWNATANTDFYRVWRLDNGKWTLLQSEVTALTFTDAWAPANAENTYRVRAYKGTVYSDCKDVTVKMIGVPQVTTTLQSNNKVKLTWKAASNADYYKVWRLDNGKWTQLASEVTGLTFTDAAAPHEASNTYRVRAYKGTVYSGCEDVTVLMIGVPQVTATRQGSSVKLSWIPTTNADYYKVWRLEGSTWVELATNVTSSSFIDSSPLSGTQTYRVRAFKGSVYSGCKDVTVNVPAALQMSTTARSRLQLVEQAMMEYDPYA